MYEFNHPSWEHYGTGVHQVLRSSFRNEDGLWYETSQTIQYKLRWGRRKARLLEWVRAQMAVTLTASERKCLEFHHFRGMSYRETALATHLHVSSVYRAVRRAVNKLHLRAEAAGGAEVILKQKRRTPWAHYYASRRRRR